MGEIKSTLDLVMERTRHLSLSQEERRKQKEEEFGKNLKGAVQKFSDGLLNVGQFRRAFDSLQEKHEISGKRMLLKEISDRIGLDQDNAPLLALLKEFGGNDAGRLGTLLKEYQDSVTALTQESLRSAKENLARNRLISGSAVIPNLEADETWISQIQDVRNAFEQKLDGEKAGLLGAGDW